MTLITSAQNLKLNYDFEYKGVVFAFYAHLFKKRLICFCFYLVSPPNFITLSLLRRCDLSVCEISCWFDT